MAFDGCDFLDVEYDKTNDSCKVTVEVIDTVEGTIENTFIIGSKHFKGKGLTNAERDKVINDLVTAEAKVIHGNMISKASEKLKSNAATKTKLHGFAKIRALK